jgi:hypothetical protein
MCTVIFNVRRGGFILGMNRDEQLSRAPALPPRIVADGGRKIIRPSEPSGGTWITVNDAGAAFALINWYAVPVPAPHRAVSRGVVTNAVAAQIGRIGTEEILRGLALRRIRPFRLIGFFSAREETCEWRWNGKVLAQVRHPWAMNIWISSGFDEPGAQRERKTVFAAALRQKSAGSLDWLRRLHRSHRPARGPYSICMHRDDAATVSHTEIIAKSGGVRMSYWGAAPCVGTKASTLEISRSV